MRLVKSLFYFSCRLAHLLSCDVGQVVVFIVRFMISPHHKDNLEPLRSQSPKRLVMAFPSSALIAVVFVGPLTSIERDKRKPVGSIAHQLVTRKTKLNERALATGFGHWHHSRLGLKVVKRFPSTLGIAQLSPKHGQNRAVLTSRQRLGGRILGEKIQRYLGFKIAKDLQRPWIVLFKRATEQIEYPRLMAPQAVVIPREQFKLLGLLRAGLQRSQMSMIGAQVLRQHVSVKRVILRLAHAKAIPDPIQRLGIDWIDHHSMVQQKIHYPSRRLLDGRPQLDPLSPALIKPAAKLGQPVDILRGLVVRDFLAIGITD